MKHIVVEFDNQLLFNQRPGLLDFMKKDLRFINQEDNEMDSVEAFEKKYNVKYKWKVLEDGRRGWFLETK
jgi:hypothetical protein